MKDKSILYLVTALKFIWATLLLFPGISKDVMSVTSIYSASLLTGQNEILTSLLYFFVGFITLYAIKRDKLDGKNLWLFIPQMLLSTLSVTGAVFATVNGSYPDGTKVPSAHIFADQVVFIIIGILVIRAIFIPYIKMIKTK